MSKPTKDIPQYPKRGDVYLSRSGTLFTILHVGMFTYVVRCEASPGVEAEFEVANKDVTSIATFSEDTWMLRIQPNLTWLLANIADLVGQIEEVDLTIKKLMAENESWSLLDVPIWATCISPRAAEFSIFAIDLFSLMEGGRPKLWIDGEKMQEVFQEEHWENIFQQDHNANLERLHSKAYNLKRELISYRGGGINPYSLLPEGEGDEIS